MTTYDPKQVLLTVGGAIIDGYAPGTFINVEQQADMWSMQVGASGEGQFSKSNDESALITITLMPGSIGNAILESMRQADLIGNLGARPLTISDPSTLTQHIATSARVMRSPTRVYSTEAQGVEWVLGTLNLKTVHGASPEIL